MPWIWLVNIVCSSRCLTCIGLGESLVTGFQNRLVTFLPAGSLFIIMRQHQHACWQTHTRFKNSPLTRRYVNVHQRTDRRATTPSDTQWLLTPVKYLFFLGPEAKTTTQTVTGNDRPCQQPYLSSWPHQAGRMHTRVHRHRYRHTQTTLNNANTICLLISNQHLSSFFFFFTLQLWLFPQSHVGLIWLIALPDVHPATGSGEAKEN